MAKYIYTLRMKDNKKAIWSWKLLLALLALSISPLRLRQCYWDHCHPQPLVSLGQWKRRPGLRRILRAVSLAMTARSWNRPGVIPGSRYQRTFHLWIVTGPRGQGQRPHGQQRQLADHIRHKPRPSSRHLSTRWKCSPRVSLLLGHRRGQYDSSWMRTWVPRVGTAAWLNVLNRRRWYQPCRRLPAGILVNPWNPLMKSNRLDRENIYNPSYDRNILSRQSQLRKDPVPRLPTTR